MKEVGIAIAGLGTVGCDVIRILQEKSETYAESLGCHPTIRAVSARNSEKPRPIDLSSYEWVDNPLDLAKREDVDIVVELIGGKEGVAHDLCLQALKQGKHVVTANKAMMAENSENLIALTKTTHQKNDRDYHCHLAFEAAIAGAIPVVKTLKESLLPNRIDRVSGILNGTCNFISSEMAATGRAFSEILALAQEKGYAEADPHFDIEGIDAAHKLCLLARLAFGRDIPFSAVDIRGITAITPVDYLFAKELGYHIRLVGIAEQKHEHGSESFYLHVAPMMLAPTHPLSQIHGVVNAVTIEGDQSGPITLSGYGAGGAPTASAVIADILDICRAPSSLPVSLPYGKILHPVASQNILTRQNMPLRYYLRFHLDEKPGSLATITQIIADCGISIEQIVQHDLNINNQVPIMIVTRPISAELQQLARTKISEFEMVSDTAFYLEMRS